MAKLIEMQLSVDVSELLPDMLAKKPTDEQKAELHSKMEAWAKVNMALPEPQRSKPPELERDYMNGAEWTQAVIERAVGNVHPEGKLQLLKRTFSLLEELKKVVEAGDKAIRFTEDNFNWLKSAIDKAVWNNNIEIARGVLKVRELFDKAEEVEV